MGGKSLCYEQPHRVAGKQWRWSISSATESRCFYICRVDWYWSHYYSELHPRWWVRLAEQLRGSPDPNSLELTCRVDCGTREQGRPALPLASYFPEDGNEVRPQRDACRQTTLQLGFAVAVGQVWPGAGSSTA